jgi:hypothetical protein
VTGAVVVEVVVPAAAFVAVPVAAVAAVVAVLALVVVEVAAPLADDELAVALVE